MILLSPQILEPLEARVVLCGSCELFSTTAPLINLCYVFLSPFPTLAGGWQYDLTVVAIVVVVVLALVGTGGFIYYLKTTACKKGEYNVRDAENSSEATCLHREPPADGEVYGIQLTQT